MRLIQALAFIVALFAIALFAAPVHAANTPCAADPDRAPVGTIFTITCTGFSPNTWLNIYAVEPDGRASGVDFYGFFPSLVKSDGDGVVHFRFYTEFPALWSVPVGHYTFVVQELGLGGAVTRKDEIELFVESRAEENDTAWLTATVEDYTVYFHGYGFVPYSSANVWVTQPDGARCSGFGIDQLSLQALGANMATMWFGPGTVKANGAGEVNFTIQFNASACIGEHIVTVATPDRSRAAEAAFSIKGRTVVHAGGAFVTVEPYEVPAYNSFLVLYGMGFPAHSTVNCWFTRPDGRVLEFINVNPKTDGEGTFSEGAVLDDFPGYTSSDPGNWTVTCATPDRSDLATGWFRVYALATDP